MPRVSSVLAKRHPGSLGAPGARSAPTTPVLTSDGNVMMFVPIKIMLLHLNYSFLVTHIFLMGVCVLAVDTNCYRRMARHSWWH